MGLPRNRSQLADWCLKELGEPIIKVNVTDEQISDRIDEAIAVFREFHYDGLEEAYIIHEITEDDVLAGFITLPDTVHGVVRVSPANMNALYDSGIFDIRYQLTLTDLYNGTGIFRGGDLNYLETMRQYVGILDHYFITQPSFQYNRKSNKLYINQSLDLLRAREGSLMLKVYTSLDSSVNIYGDVFLRAYAVSLIKKQWGSNLKKFDGVQLLGGIKLDGQKIYDEAVAELAVQYERLRSTWETPPDFMVG